MRKSLWQRWTLIFLLMARLVIGELGHAMPVAHSSTLEQPTTEMAGDPPCAEHDSGQQALTHPGDASGHASTHPEGEHDCCKSGDCKCPCLHVPCMTLDAALMKPVSTALLRMPYGADAVPSARPSGLFRPPA